MKAITYHYVRPENRYLPYARYLKLSNFKQQLDYFEQQFGFDSPHNLGRSSGKVLLTFDDGLIDHYLYVYPELKARGLSGLFFISSGPYFTSRLLDVHRLHVILGQQSSQYVLNVINDLIEPEIYTRAEWQSIELMTYRGRNDEPEKLTVLRLLNYVLQPAERQSIINHLAARFIPNEAELVTQFYLHPEQIREMQANGMMFANHTASHLNMAGLPHDEQFQEIHSCHEFLKALDINQPCLYAHPYGGPLSYDHNTAQILNDTGYEYAFAVEARDINRADWQNNKMTLPRYDCNQFQSGKASCDEDSARHTLCV